MSGRHAMILELNNTRLVIQIGFYPGILIGFRSYLRGEINAHVLYMPFFDISFLTMPIEEDPTL